MFVTSIMYFLAYIMLILHNEEFMWIKCSIFVFMASVFYFMTYVLLILVRKKENCVNSSFYVCVYS